MTETRPTRYRFGAFLLDAGTLELSRDGTPVHVEPLPARILVALVERAGELVSREDLREVGWPRLPDAAEQSLNTCIRQIRAVLGDTPNGPEYIQTLRGRGYRFVAPVTVVASVPPGVDSRRWTRARIALVAVAAFLVLAVVAASWIVRSRTSPMRLVVPPPTVLGDVGDAKLLGEALGDELRTALAVVAPQRVRVLGTVSTRRLYESAGRGAHPPSENDVSHRLEVSVRPHGTRELRLMARLVRTDDGTLAWGGAIDAGTNTLGDAAAVLAREVAAGLGVRPTVADPRRPELPLRERAMLLKARYLVDQSSELPTALALLDTLAASEPTLAAAHGLRGEVLLFLEESDAAAAAASRALALDPDEPAAHRALAGVRMLAGDWARAESLLRENLSRAPNEARTLSALAFLLTVRGRFAEARGAMRRARYVDPLSPLLAGDAGLLDFWAGRYGEAERACREAGQLRPDAPWVMGCVFDALVQSGRVKGAADEVRHILSAVGTPAAIPAGVTAGDVVARYRSLRVSAWERAAREDSASAFGLALAYADSRRPADALDALQRAAAHPTLATLTMAVDPRLRPLRADPRYRALLRRFRLTDG